MPLPSKDQAPDFNSPEYIFSKIQDFSSILRDMSLNVSPGQAVPTKFSQLNPDQSLNSSLGLLPADTMSCMDTSTTSLDIGNCPPSNISLGRYLQPAHTSLTSQSEPLSDSDDEENIHPQSFTVPQPQSLAQESSSVQPLLDTPPQPFLVPFPVPPTTTQVHTSSTPLQAHLKCGPQLQKVLTSQTSGWANLSSNSVGEFEASGGFPWDKIVKGDATQDISSLQKHLSPDLSTLSDSWHQNPQDPSFCSGKFSARSTSFGGENNTRDENFSDFGPVPSFQSQDSFSSHYTTNTVEDSIFQGGFPVQTSSEAFPGFDVAAQAELGMEFGDQEFGSFGKEQLKCFLDQEEAECLQANPFIEEEQCEEPANSSAFSGVSDKSIMLRNSNLWGGNTSKVNLGQLRIEHQLLTKVSRCEYFRHNSSRLGSLEETVPDCDRPGLGFVHNIRSPERRPCALLSETVAGSIDSQPTTMSSTFSMEQEKAKDTQGRVSDEGSANSDSAPSSANTTYMHSGNSTKTVVSLMDQSGTLKAGDLASRLQTLADQLGSAQAQSVSYPDVVEDSISSNLCMESQLEASIRESFVPGNEINLSTISKVLSDASVSSDPQHFVSVLLGCLKKRELGADQAGVGEVSRSSRVESQSHAEDEETVVDLHPNEEPIANVVSSKKEEFEDGFGSLQRLPSNTPSSASSIRRTTTGITPATLPRARKSCTPPTTSTRLSHTPTSKMTPTVSKRAMLRLTPSSAEPLSRVRPGVRPMSGHSKLMKPFGTVGSVPHSQVVPVKPQPNSNQISSQPASAPNSARATPTPLLCKTTSLPTSLNTSNRQRRPSGARHSSPIKKSVTITSSPSTLASTPITNDLSKLLDSAETPSLHLSSNSHLTTSTPFHNGLNLSTVILDHLTNNQSVSPFINPDNSISPVNLDVSTISPALYTSLVKPVKRSPSARQEIHLPHHATVELPTDWTHSSVFSSHTKVVVSVPVNHNLTSSSSMVIKVTSMWVGSCLVPPQHWEQVVDTKWEKLVTLEHDKGAFDMELMMKKAGIFTLNIGVMLQNGVSSSGLVRFQVEEPNIQVLTDNGSRIEFGSLPENCLNSVPLVLVNCGACSVPLHLEIRQPNDLFSFVGGSKVTSFNIPGVVGTLADGQGVAKEIELFVNTVGISVVQPRIFQTELLVMLGDVDGILLGTVDIMVRVGTARLRTKKSVEPVLFNCMPGESVTQSVQLRNCGNITLVLETFVEDMSQGSFSCANTVQISPDCDFSLPVTFTSSPQASLSTSQHSLYLSVTPNGPKHLINLQTNVLPNQESIQEFQTSRPVLSFGVIKKTDTMSPSHEFNNNEAIPSIFPVESDQSLINFFSVPVGTKEEQLITLRNSTSETVCLNMIIRETDNFSLLVPAGPVSTSQLVLPPQATQDVKVVYRPTRVGIDRGKLVLKPQGRKVGGKSFKASISLCGVAGSCNIEMEGLEEVEANRYQLSCQQFPAKNMVRFMNKGESTGFVKIRCDVGVTKLDISPSEFLLESGFAKDVYISYHEECDMSAPLITIFTGPELVRQVMKRAILMPGASRLIDNPSLMGINFTEDFPGEKISAREEFSGQLTALDSKHFYQKTAKHLLSLSMPSRPADFDQLVVEETLSETRIDQSIAMPLPTTYKTLSHQVARKANPFQPAIFPTQVKRSPFSPQMPNSPPNPDSHLLLIPSHLSLTSGGESMFKLVNKSPHPLHWDLSWPSSKLSISPGAGLLSPHGQTVVCVQAVPGQTSWKGQVSVYSDNSVDTMEVVVAAAVSSPCITVSTKQVEMGVAVLGSTTSGSIVLTNAGLELAQWKAQVSPSFFSLPQCAGLLNPSQSISLPLIFKPAATGSHSASLSLTSTTVRGGQDTAQSAHPVVVTMRGTAVSITEVVPTQPNPSEGHAKPQPKKSSGTVSLESELVMFSDTMVGETTVSKVKIKNRSGSDQAVEILSLPADSPFKTVHSVLEVKNQCYCTVPVQFRPMDRGDFNAIVTFMWEGNMIRAKLKGKAV